jgi:hypothetical protein
MKKSLFVVVVSVAAVACYQRHPEVRNIRGNVLDAYSHSVMIQENDSVTTWIQLTDATDMTECDGLAVGQSVAAECKVTESTTGEVLTAIKVIAPDMPYEHYIVGSWVEPNPVAPDFVQGFTLEADGSAHSINTNEVTYRSWQLRGNRLVLVAESADDASFEQQIVYIIRGASGRKLTLESEIEGELSVYSRQ